MALKNRNFFYSLGGGFFTNHDQALYLDYLNVRASKSLTTLTFALIFQTARTKLRSLGYKGIKKLGPCPLNDHLFQYELLNYV